MIKIYNSIEIRTTHARGILIKRKLISIGFKSENGIELNTYDNVNLEDFLMLGEIKVRFNTGNESKNNQFINIITKNGCTTIDAERKIYIISLIDGNTIETFEEIEGKNFIEYEGYFYNMNNIIRYKENVQFYKLDIEEEIRKLI